MVHLPCITWSGASIFQAECPKKNKHQDSMTDNKKDRRGNRGDPASLVQPQYTHESKEYNYVLQLTPADLDVLKKYHEQLAHEARGFAEIYYNYLFDNPDIAGILYAYEREGGDTGQLIRLQLDYLLGCITTPVDPQRENMLVNTGRQHVDRNVRPVWVIGAYRLLIEHLCKRLNVLDITLNDRGRLESVLLKMLLRDLGLTMEGFWRVSVGDLQNEIRHLCDEQGRVEDLLAGLPHFMWSVDVKASKVVYANYPLHSLYQGELEAPFPCLPDTCEEDRQLVLDAWQGAVNGNSCHTEIRIALAGNGQHWYRMSLYPSINRSGRTVQVHCMLEDISRQISERRQLEKLATTDALTRLPNRALWSDHLNMALANSRRVPGSQVVVISLDINHFRMYNDTLGREVGDLLLREVAERLDSIVRETDSLARLGGDQFGILLQPVNNARTATERVITQIMDSFEMPFAYQGKQMCIGLTMGVALFPEDGTSEESLLGNAESAMHRAKRNGLPYQYFDPVNDVSPVEKLRYSGQIRSALDNNEFELHYQPQVDIHTSCITGAEALLRWDHPAEGIVMPKRIIPVAEQLGMITHITDWVLVTALRQCRQWSFENRRIPVSVNVSARSFQNPRLLEKIDWALQEAGVSGDCLEIEITEATLMQDLERATQVLNKLSENGVTIAIDDFGTGYSSLSYLKRLPIHTLKIDQSFIMDVAFDRQDVAIVRSIIDLGHNLGCKVVAEGVESSTAWNMLNKLGCDAAQGFHISKPLADDHFFSWLSENNPPC
jgi:diguanylate cyclase (GGDEF)-like protein